VTPGPEEASSLAKRLLGGDRAVLARAVTLSESTRPQDREAARSVLARIWPRAGGAMRIGVTGPPGVGKSSFIETFGNRILREGRRLAVLAIDPSSLTGGGAILGDKSRMPRLAADDNAYVRPSPSLGASGGVSSRTREALAFLEAAGHDVVIIETVGAGQGEAAVAGMVDVFLLLVAPGGGDELQGVKRGVMELADLVLVNKADGDLAPQASRTRAEYASALRLLRRRPTDPDGIPMALSMSAATDAGVGEVWREVCKLDEWRRASGVRDRLRGLQAAKWIRDAVEGEIRSRAVRQAENLPTSLVDDVVGGRMDPETAARELLASSLG